MNNKTNPKYNSNMKPSNVNTETSHPAEFDYFTPTIPNRIAFDLSLTVHDLRVYMIVNSFAHTTGDAYASNRWIAKKLGITTRSVIRSINVLCNKKYIEREEVNGHRHLKIVINSMRNEIKGESQPYDEGVTHVSGGGDTRVRGGCQPCHPINNKIINNKNIKTTTTEERPEKKKSSSDFVISKEIDPKLLSLREKYLQADELDRTDEEFLRQCSHHLDNGDKQKYNLARRLKGLETIIKAGFFEKPAGYSEKRVIKSIFTPEETALICTYQHALRMEELGIKLEVYMPDASDVKKAIKLMEKAKNNKPPLDKRFGMMGFSSI